MRELGDIEAALLLNEDATSRSLNFDSPTWAGVEDLLDSLEVSFGDVSGYVLPPEADQEGHAIGPPLGDAVVTGVQSAGEQAFLDFRGGNGLVKSLQLDVWAEDDGSPFVELTLFPPEDLEPTPSLRDDFIAWVHELQTCLRARRCYARYECASWKLGDTFGVFFVSDGGCDEPPDGQRATG